MNEDCQSNYSSESLPNFETLSYGTLRRYQSFFGIEVQANDKTSLLKAIKEHFEQLEVDSDKVRDNFVKIEKDQSNDKINSLRKSIRFQEKNMAKFFDSFSYK